MKNIPFSFSGKIWRSSPDGGWYFVTVPTAISNEIRSTLKWAEEGWGRLKVQTAIGEFKWDTSIWFDTKKNAYLIPLKSEARQKCRLTESQTIDLTIYV
jgi:hypothetical protein